MTSQSFLPEPSKLKFHPLSRKPELHTHPPKRPLHEPCLSHATQSFPTAFAPDPRQHRSPFLRTEHGNQNVQTKNAIMHFTYVQMSNHTICGHRTLKAPHPVRSAKLSKVSPSQYCGGGPRGNPRCCSSFFLPIFTSFYFLFLLRFFGLQSSNSCLDSFVGLLFYA